MKQKAPRRLQEIYTIGHIIISADPEREVIAIRDGRCTVLFCDENEAVKHATEANQKLINELNDYLYSGIEPTEYH